MIHEKTSMLDSCSIPPLPSGIATLRFDLLAQYCCPALSLPKE